MTKNSDQPFHVDTWPSRWRQSITWSAVVVLGLLVYEFTTQPILGVIVICSKFGWNDFLIAYLLQRVDPNRVRSRAVFWFCLASGLLRVIFASIILAIALFLMLGAPFGPGAFQAMVLRVISAFGVVFVGYLLITGTVFRGVICAGQSQIKIWLPSFRTLGGSKMHLENLVDSLLVLGFIPLYLLGFAIFPLLGSFFEPQGLLLIPFIGLGLLWCGLLFILFCMIFLRVKRRISASNPYECWECDAVSKAMIANISNGKRVHLLIQINRALSYSDAERSKP